MPRLSNREDVYERLMAGELLFSDLVLVARESEAEHERHAVHRERVTTNSATLASMLSSSMREGSLDEVTLTLPPGTLHVFRDWLRWSYNGNIPDASSMCPKHLVSLWRLSEYIGADSLLRSLEDLIRQRLDPREFCDLANACHEQSSSRFATLLLFSASPFAEMLSLDPTAQQAAESAALERLWEAVDSCGYEVVGRLLDLLSLSDVTVATVVLPVLARTAGPSWITLPEIALLSPFFFGLLMSHIPHGEISEALKCEIIISYVDRRKLAGTAVEPAVQALLIRLIDLSVLSGDFVKCRLWSYLPKNVLPGLRELLPLLNVTAQSFTCPYTMLLLDERNALRFPCGHAVSMVLPNPHPPNRKAYFKSPQCPVVGCASCQRSEDLSDHVQGPVADMQLRARLVNYRSASERRVSEFRREICSFRESFYSSKQSRHHDLERPPSKRRRSDDSDLPVLQVGLRDPDGSTHHWFAIPATENLLAFLLAQCRRVGLVDLFFYYKGERIGPETSPAILGVTDGDCISYGPFSKPGKF
jgi:hypothetical protein